jgi:erythronate-4-phosphate dehydrogenase
MARTSASVGMRQFLTYNAATVLAIADRNIPQLADALAGLCELRVLPSAELTRENLRDADLLFTRSTVKLGPALLEGSRVRFVATATIGTDHLDLPWLTERGIAWASAPGSNADSVLEWFAAALLTLHERGALDLTKLRVGIVGVGNVGSRVERFCRALELPVLRCDPPRLAREGGDFVPLDRLLRESELVTLHVPLDAHTRHLFDPARARGWLVNASRGEVLDTRALLAARPKLVLDVFENEPAPSQELIDLCALATPHIAGHSLEGKLAGTRMVYEAACNFLGVPARWRPTLPELPPLELAGSGDEQLLLSALRSRYRIEDDDAALRQFAAPDFRRYREQYPARRQLSGAEIRIPPARPRLAAALTALGAVTRPAR